jgi:hypothetical protein
MTYAGNLTEEMSRVRAPEFPTGVSTPEGKHNVLTF